MARVRRADRPALRRGDALPAGGRRLRHRRLGLHDGDRRGGRRLHARTLGLKVGLLHITCFRPFPSADIVRALRHVKAIAVIERLDIPMMQSNPQLCEIKAAFADAMAGTPGYPRDHPHAEVHRRLGRSGQPRRARRRLHRHRGEHAQRAAAALLHRRHQARNGAPGHDRSRRARRPVRSPCAAIRSAATVRSPPTRSSPPSPARSSAWTCRPIRSTGRRRRACRPPTT